MLPRMEYWLNSKNISYQTAYELFLKKKKDKIKINQQQELKPDLPFLFSTQIWSQESQNHSQNEQPRITQNFIQQIYKWV
jgi:hypothetical protein